VRDEVPMPPLKPKATVPVPAPTARSCGCQQDGSFDLAQFIYLRGSGEFAEAIRDDYRAGNLLAKEITVMRQDGRNPGSHSVTLHEGRMTDAHACNIRNGIQSAGGQRAGPQSNVASPRPVLRGGIDTDRDEDNGRKDSHDFSVESESRGRCRVKRRTCSYS
jgi:hypothetical protein